MDRAVHRGAWGYTPSLRSKMVTHPHLKIFFVRYAHENKKNQSHLQHKQHIIQPLRTFKIS